VRIGAVVAKGCNTHTALRQSCAVPMRYRRSLEGVDE
jgi:hypothetical protein